MKKYQITGQILLAADGWVKAKNKKAAEKIWQDWCFSETQGLSTLEVKINEVICPNSKYYDKDNIPPNKDFDNYDKNCLTHNYWN